jgi:hypothetical protein
MTRLAANSQLLRARTLFVFVLGLSLTACFFSTRGIYYDKEQAVAERAVSQFHDLHNQKKFEAIYALMEKPASDTEFRAQILAATKTTFETVGKVKSSKLVEKKVFPSPIPGFTSQVKLAYDTEFEKGNWTEFFAWNIKNTSEAVLAEYHVDPKPTESDSAK